jgi:chemotaxis protein methyltransferase CheR
MSEADDAVEDLEIQLLLEGVYQRYGIDFRRYAPSSLRRRIGLFAQKEQVATASALQERLLRDTGCMDRFVRALSVNVTAMFRDPDFYRGFREKVVPRLRTYPFIRIWHAGCATGEEVYSLAILLQEEGLYERSRLYATDMNDWALAQAKDAIYPLEEMLGYEADYRRAGGKGALSDYYRARYGRAIFRRELRKNIVWSQHNLVTDGSFNEFHVILCRNVLIYFDRALQARVHRLLYESLIPFGVLGFGQKESIRFTPHEDAYVELEAAEKWYRKIRA